MILLLTLSISISALHCTALHLENQNQKKIIQTAPFDQVLPGSTAKKLTSILGEDCVCFECPQIAEIDQWCGAFLTSASRLVLPIGAIHFGSKR